MSTQSLAFTVPLLPEMTDVDRAAMQSCWRGDRRADHEESRRRLGITRESVWIQPTPDGAGSSQGRTIGSDRRATS